MIGRKKRKAEVKDTGPKGFDDYDVSLGDLMRGERATMGKSLLDVQRELPSKIPKAKTTLMTLLKSNAKQLASK